ncbi:MAG: C2H2-type zinc finger protein, partial [Endozoicomonadaceae bacterium]|nr:C2H2-type zinc finger protein [Endozoicomonadaceae bacterium]
LSFLTVASINRQYYAVIWIKLYMFLIHKKGSLFFFTVLILLLGTIMLKGLTVYAASDNEECAEIKSDQRNEQTTRTNKATYPCNNCDLIFRRQSYLDRHNCKNTKKKTKNLLYECKKCTACFPTEYDLIRHQTVHLQYRPFVCKICNKAFKSDLYLIKHERRHIKKKLFVCKICDRSFEREIELNVHNIKDHGQTEEHLAFMCEYAGCYKAYQFKEALDRHIKYMHLSHNNSSEAAALPLEDLSPTSPDGETYFNFTCDKCNQSYKYKTSLDRHKQLKHLPCGSQVRDPKALKVHEAGCVTCQNAKKPQELICPKPTRTIRFVYHNATKPKKPKKIKEPKRPKKIKESKKPKEPGEPKNQSEVNDLLNEFSTTCTNIIFTMRENLLMAENSISNNDYRFIELAFMTVANNIITFNQLIPAFQSADSKITGNRNTPKFEMILSIFEPEILISLSHGQSVEHLIIDIRQRINNVSDYILEIIKDWQAELENTNIDSSEKILNEGYEIIWLQDNDINDENLDKKTELNNQTLNTHLTNDCFKQLTGDWDKIIRTTKENLLEIASKMSDYDYSDAVTIFDNILQHISELKQLIPSLQYTDFIVTGNKNISKIETASIMLKYFEVVTLTDCLNDEKLIDHILRQIDTSAEYLCEVFDSWRSALLESKSINSPNTDSPISPEDYLTTPADYYASAKVNQ